MDLDAVWLEISHGSVLTSKRALTNKFTNAFSAFLNVQRESLRPTAIGCLSATDIRTVYKTVGSKWNRYVNMHYILRRFTGICDAFIEINYSEWKSYNCVI